MLKNTCPIIRCFWNRDLWLGDVCQFDTFLARHSSKTFLPIISVFTFLFEVFYCRCELHSRILQLTGVHTLSCYEAGWFSYVFLFCCSTE